MPSRFTCPHCGAQIERAEECAGEGGVCSQCGKAIAVPVAAEAEGDVARRGSSLLNWITAGGVFAAAVILVMLLLPAIQASRSSRRDPCINNLHCLGTAMHTYLDANGCLPPAYIADENGKPMHSWRVLLLPYLEAEDLYREYRFDEPWNGPHNAALARRMPGVFRCPDDPATPGRGETSDVMVVGPGTISDGPTATTIPEMTDGTFQTILLVEAANSGILWTEPRDLDAKELVLGVNSGGNAGIRSGHPAVACAVFGDGSVHSLSSTIPPELLIDLSTIAGGEDATRFFQKEW